MGQTNSSQFYGIFFLGTAAQAFEVIHFNTYNEIVLNYITIGNIIEIHFFIRGTADEIIKAYQGLVGRSQLPPYYAMGFFQAGYYSNLDDIKKSIKAYNDAKMSVEGYHIDNYY